MRSPARPFSVKAQSRIVPAVLWLPEGPARGLVLALHGGSGHKESPAILAIRDELLTSGLAVAAIDGPVHGDRRSDGLRDPDAVKAAFREAWRHGVGQLDVATDLRAVLDHLLELPELRRLPVGYIGVSMGTAYGLPFLAHEPRVRAAVIGLWSAGHVNSSHLAACAAQVRCPVWFTQQWDDQIFDRDSTLSLFDAVGSADKRLVAYPGPHRELEGERLCDAADFLRFKLQQPA